MQDVLKTPSRCLQNVLRNVFTKKSSTRLGRQKIVTLKTCWRHLQDTQMFAGQDLKIALTSSRARAWKYGSSEWTKHYIDFQQSQGVYLLKKYIELSKLVAFGKKCSILQTRMDQRRGRMKMNFDYFQIQKWLLQTVRVEKVGEKIGSFVQFPCFLLKLWSLNLRKMQFL